MSSSINTFKTSFSDSAAMLQEINTIAHLASIDASFGKKAQVRLAALESMDQLSCSLLKVSEELEGESHMIDQASLAKRVGALPVAYFDLDAIELTAEKIKKVARSIQKDARTLSIAPIRRPNLGIHGPTFLVNYHRLRDNGDLSFCSFVIKKTTYFETIPNRIYHEFASHCEQAIGKKLFGSPNIATIDFAAKTYQNPLGQTTSLQANENVSLLNSFSSIARSTKSNLDSLSIVMLAEKIEGQNILDFLTSERYVKATSQQKADFFFKVGLLSILDLVIGNFERFIAIEMDIPDFLSHELPANLGNALISSENNSDSDGYFNLFAIDNGIAPMLTKQLDERLEWSAQNIRKRYSEFLKKQLANPQGIERLLNNIIYSFKIVPTVTPQKRRKLLEPFLKDLENSELCHNNLRKGLLQMGTLLKKEIIPYWNSSRAADLKAAIHQNFTEALEPLNERLDLFDKFFFNLV